MDQTNDGWGAPVGQADTSTATPAQTPAPTTPTATANPGMLAYVNSLTSNGIQPTDALKMAMKMPQYASSKFSFSPSPDGKGFVDNAASSGKVEAGWGPATAATPVSQDKSVQAPPSVGAKITGTIAQAAQEQWDAAKQDMHAEGQNIPAIAKAAYGTVKQDIQNIGKNLPARQMTPQEFQAASALGILPKGATPQSAMFSAMAPAGQDTSSLKLPVKGNDLSNVLTKSMPANFVRGMFTSAQQERVKYNKIQSYLQQNSVLTDPKSSPAQKANAQQTINLLKEPNESLSQSLYNLAVSFHKDPTGTVKQLVQGAWKGIKTDPELLAIGGGDAGITAFSDAAKAAGASEKVIQSLKVMEHSLHGAGQGAVLNAGIAAAQGVGSPTGVVSPQAVGTAAVQGAGLGAVLGAAGGAEQRAPSAEPDPAQPGWSKPTTGQEVGPVNPQGGGNGGLPVTTDNVLPHQSDTAQLRLGKPGDVNSPHEPGQPIATNTPIDDTGTVGLSGGTSEDLKGLHVDKEFPSTKELTNRYGQKVTLPVKDIVTQVHEAEEGPLMHPVGPVPVDKIHDLMDRAGKFATPKIFSPAILKDIADGKPLGYVPAHNIATAIENNHVETNYNVDHKVYQDSLLPHIKQIQKRAEGEPASDVPATLGNKPYDDSNVSHLVEGQSKPSVGGLPGRYHGTSHELNNLSNDYAQSGDNRNIFGQGFYTTDSLPVSKGYSRKGKGNTPNVYNVSEKGNPNLYDMEKPIDPNIKDIVKTVMGDYFPHEDIDGKPLNTLRGIYNEFRAESQNNGLSRDEVQGYFDSIRHDLEQQGYNGFSHIGGVNKTPHNVKIYWTPEDHVSISKQGEPAQNDIQENNASGESSASVEAINRLQQERANGQERYLINRDGSVEPVIGVDGVDKVARPGQVIVQKNVGAHKWTVLSHGEDVSPDMAQGYVNRAAPKLAQAGKIDPKLLLALGVGALGAMAGAYLYQKHPVKGAMMGATAAMMLAGSHPIKFLAALRDATSGSKKINIASFLDIRDGMMADSSRARVQAQDHLSKMIPSKQERINVDNHLDDPKRYPNVTPKEKQAAEYIRNVYDSLGKVAMDHGVLDAMIKDYNSRRWEQTPETESILQQILAAKQKASATGTNSVHNIKRVFVTKAEGIAAGLKPVTEDAIENLGMYWDSMTRTLANKITLDSLKNGKIPGTSNTLIMPVGKAPASYVANPRLPGVLIHPDIAQQLSQVYYLKDVNPFVRGLSALNTLQKRTAVIASAFHAVSLAQAHFSANSVLHPIKNTRDIIMSMLGKSEGHKTLMTGGPKDDLGGLLRAGMKIQLPQGDGVDIDYNQDYYPALKAAQGYLNSVLPGSGKLVGGIEKVSKLSDKFVFTYAHAGMKMATGLHTLARMQMSWAKALQKDPHTIVPSDEHMHKEVASFVNNVYGGLDWRKAADESQTELGKMLSYAAYGPTGRTLLSFAFFAPDWLISTLRSAAKATGVGTALRRRAGTATTEEMLYHSGGTGFKGFVNPKTSTDFHRLYQVRNAFYFMLIGSALNMYFSGHSLMDNKKDGVSPLRVDMGNGEYMEFNKHGMEAYTMLEDPSKFFINKLGVIPKESAEFLFNKDYLNASGGAPPYSGVLNHAVNAFTPFTFSNMIGKSPRDIALNLAGSPVYGKTNEQRAADKASGEAKAKETRRKHLEDDPLYYYHKRQDARERKLRGD